MLAAVMAGCHEAPEYKDDPYGNFDALAAIVGERYCFFEEKGIDWEKLCRQYRAEIKPDMNQLELFDICSRLLDELQDGHVNLSSRFNTSYYRNGGAIIHRISTSALCSSIIWILITCRPQVYPTKC